MKFKGIALCGFMGSGKTTVAKRLSVLMGMESIDTDVCIEKKYTMSVAELFDKYGEKRFREMELECIKDICHMKRAVISTGGGTFSEPEAVKIVRENGIIIVYLKSDFESIYRRIRENKARPLVIEKSKEELRALYEERCKLYESIADIIEDSEKSPEMICRHLKKELMMQKAFSKRAIF